MKDMELVILTPLTITLKDENERFKTITHSDSTISFENRKVTKERLSKFLKRKYSLIDTLLKNHFTFVLHANENLSKLEVENIINIFQDSGHQKIVIASVGLVASGCVINGSSIPTITAVEINQEAVLSMQYEGFEIYQRYTNCYSMNDFESFLCECNEFLKKDLSTFIEGHDEKKFNFEAWNESREFKLIVCSNNESYIKDYSKYNITHLSFSELEKFTKQEIMNLKTKK